MKKILFVEDDLMIIRIYRGKFQVEGYEVQVATDGESALTALGQCTPDLVLLDLQLPKVNGVQILQRIRANPATKNLPVIVFSNAFIGQMVDDAWKAGATKCLTKASCTPRQLIDIIRRVMQAAADAPPSGATAPAELRVAEGPAAANHKPNFPHAGEPLSHGGVAAIPAYDLPRDFAQGTPAATPAGSVTPLTPSESEPWMDARSQEILRRMFVNTAPHTLATIRAQLLAVAREEVRQSRIPLLQELFQTIHSFTGNAGLAGFRRLGQLSAATEALVHELQHKPETINGSTLRTLVTAVEVIGALAVDAHESVVEPSSNALVLAVDDDRISLSAVIQSLERSSLGVVALDDPHLALRVATLNRFDLLILDVDLPGMSGFELAPKLRALPGNQKAAILFVTGLNDFESRARSTLCGGSDLIAKPFLLIELAVKALCHAFKPQPRQADRAHQSVAA